jgi:hypothetical protein
VDPREHFGALIRPLTEAELPTSALFGEVFPCIEQLIEQSSFKIPVSDRNFQRIFLESRYLAESSFVVSTDSTLVESANRAFASLSLHSQPDSEDSGHVLVDIVALIALNGFAQDVFREKAPLMISFIRNSSGWQSQVTSATKPQKRPDQLGFCNKTLCYIAEEKARGIYFPTDEITEKLKEWTPALRGSAPMLFGHVRSGERFQFVAVDTSNSVHLLGPVLDLTTANGIAWVLRAGLQLYRIINTWKTRGVLLPPLVELETLVIGIQRDTGIEIKLEGLTKICKTWPFGYDVPADMQALDSLLSGQTAQWRLEHPTLAAIHVPSHQGHQYRVLTWPLCSEDKPATHDELRTCAVHVAHALATLHELGACLNFCLFYNLFVILELFTACCLGFCHNDVRWFNVMCNSEVTAAGRQWVLIDFDHATRPGKKLHGNHPLKGQPAGPTTDFYYLGHMLQSWTKEVLDEEMTNISKDLCSPQAETQKAAISYLLDVPVQ